MDKKRIYIRPSVCIVKLNSHAHLLTISDTEEVLPNEFLDDSEWDWDSEGAN